MSTCLVTEGVLINASSLACSDGDMFRYRIYSTCYSIIFEALLAINVWSTIMKMISKSNHLSTSGLISLLLVSICFCSILKMANFEVLTRKNFYILDESIVKSQHKNILITKIRVLTGTMEDLVG
jgi:hypothetical protein